MRQGGCAALRSRTVFGAAPAVVGQLAQVTEDLVIGDFAGARSAASRRIGKLDVADVSDVLAQAGDQVLAHHGQVIAVELHLQRGVIRRFQYFLHLCDVADQKARHVDGVDGFQRGGDTDGLEGFGGVAGIAGEGMQAVQQITLLGLTPGQDVDAAHAQLLGIRQRLHDGTAEHLFAPGHAGEAIAALHEVARRVIKEEAAKRTVISSWTALVAYVRLSLQHEAREQFRVLYLDNRNQLILDEIQNRGTIDHAPVYPREVVRRALELSAKSMIIVHNHPSGDPTPSRPDIDMTRQVIEAARALGLGVHDHLIVGRDHAGVGEYYGPFDAHHIFDQIKADALITQPLKIDWTFWCNKCGTMASMRTCPHEAADRVLVSGTKLRKALSEGEEVQEGFSRPEVLEVLRRYYASLQEHEKVKVELKGHSAR